MPYTVRPDDEVLRMLAASEKTGLMVAADVGMLTSTPSIGTGLIVDSIALFDWLGVVVDRMGCRCPSSE